MSPLTKRIQRDAMKRANAATHLSTPLRSSDPTVLRRPGQDTTKRTPAYYGDAENGPARHTRSKTQIQQPVTPLGSGRHLTPPHFQPRERWGS